jgi:hypothetical protein
MPDAPSAPFEVRRTADRGAKTGTIVPIFDLNSEQILLNDANKKWAVTAMLGYRNDDPAWIALEIKSGTCHTRAEFGTLFNLSKKKITMWFDAYNKGRASQDVPGKPRALDEEAMEMVRHSVAAGRGTTNGNRVNLTCAEVSACFTKGRKDTAARNGKTILQIEDIKPLSKGSLYNYSGEYDLRKAKAQVVVDARAKSAKDIRMVIAFAALMLKHYGPLPPWKKWNSDSYGLAIKPRGSGHQVYYLKRTADADDHEAKYTREVLKSDAYQDGNMTFFKITVIGHADGEVGEMVCWVAVPGMPDGKTFIRKVLGFSHTGEISGSGWLVICSTRAGNPEAFKWLHKDFYCPTIRRCDEQYLDLPGGQMKPAFYIDGEIGPCVAMNDPDVQKAYHDAQETVLKGIPMGTDLHQAWDATTFFMNMHQVVDKVARNAINVEHEGLTYNVNKVFQEFRREFPAVSVTKKFVDKTIYGLQVAVYASQETLRRQKVRAGFQDTGQHIRKPNQPSYHHPGFDQLPFGTTVDTHKMLSKCTSVITNEQLDLIDNSMCELVSEVERIGTVTNAKMDELGLPSLPPGEQSERENAPVWKCYPCNLTHPSQNEKVSLWRRGHDPEELKKKRKREKELAEANKMLKKYEEKERAKEEATKKRQESAAAKEEERQLLARMTPAQKKDYKAQQAAQKATAGLQTAQAKAQKDQAKAAKADKEARLAQRAQQFVNGERESMEESEGEEG